MAVDICVSLTMAPDSKNAWIARELAMIHTELNKFATQRIAQWVVNGTVDAEWDAYRRQLDNIGLPRLIEIRQKAYDSFKN